MIEETKSRFNFRWVEHTLDCITSSCSTDSNLLYLLAKMIADEIQSEKVKTWFTKNLQVM